MKASHIEILAPAGSFETLHAAINAGASSVYFGIADFNMRASAAANFQPEDLKEIVKLCKGAGVKTCLTVNTVLYDDDLETMRNVVDLAKKEGVTAIIAADMATIMYCNEVGIEAHASTQLSISNIETLKFFSQFVDRVVLARELNLEQVREISRQIKKLKIEGPRGDLIEIEAFAHGALCVAVSGRCAMSLYCYDKSANKGKCTQICRRRFKVTDIETKKELEIDNNYVMSAADLCTIGMLPELVDAGVKVLKFEGRGRPAEYVDTVITTYKEALGTIENGTYSEQKVKQWNKQLATVFNRGFSKGLYMGRHFDEWAGTHGSKSTFEKSLIGKVEKYYPKIKVAQVLIQSADQIKVGDNYAIIGPTTGIVKGDFKEIMIDGKIVGEAKQGEVITFKINSKVRKNDKFFVFRERKSKYPRGKEKLLKY